MKKIMKKVFGLMLALVMVLSLMPMTAKAAETLNADGSFTSFSYDGFTDCQYSYTPTADGTLTIEFGSYDWTCWVYEGETLGLDSVQVAVGNGEELSDAGQPNKITASVEANQAYLVVVRLAESGDSLFIASFTEGASGSGAAGTESDPIELTSGDTITLGGMEEKYYKIPANNGEEYTLTLQGSGRMDSFDVYVYHPGRMMWSYAASAQMGMPATATVMGMDGCVFIKVVETGRMGASITVTLAGAGADEDPLGSETNPDALPVDEELEAPITLVEDERGNYFYYYTWTAEKTGKLYINVYGNPSGWAWNYAVMGGYWGTLVVNSADTDVNPGEYPVKAGEKITVWFAKPGYSAGQIYFAATFVECEYPVVEGPKFETLKVNEVTEKDADGNVNVIGWDEYQMATEELVVGENTAYVSEENVTLYEFTAEKHAVYKISVEEGCVGYWGTVAALSTTGKLTDPESTVKEIEVTLQANESAIVGLTGVDADTTVINVEKVKDVADEEVLPWTEYENKSEIKDYTFEGTFDSTENYVDVEDDVVDKAVLGEDGYYHLNSADGPILLVKLDGKYGNIDPLSAAQNAALKGYDADGAKWEYSAAYLEYYAAADETTGLYPLTADLITILQNAGEAQGWYSEVLDGVTTEDGWMFNLYYVPVTTSAPAPIDPTDTGDHSNIALWAAVLGLGVVAIAGSVVMRKREF